MGRAFEFRKERKFKRWGHMAKTFTKIGKEITIAVKNGGPDVTGNPRLRALLQTARSENMPKENIERAIKKATDKDQADYKEVVYEGYGPHGVAILVETATDNTNRTVANVRSYFNKFGGNLGTSGSVSFMFDHKCVFKIKNSPDIDLEELELELIDFGADEVFVDEFENKDGDTEEVVTIYGEYTAFNNIQKYIEDKGFELVSAGFDRFPNGEMKHLTAEERVDLDKLLEKLEEDDDVQNVFHNLAEE
ncbi:MAG: YebC/PmpR family DNA-binding transcriptional regulator [Bacteroidales bacterium]|jgi:YebC/PmpR family DNA-binding regulatory protein|nr:YebC/PmpR family DNA-binding transcriptional regulator [Bacteroidales bacterium]MBQ1708773.1 YebC/PmpR family DNA-binding transcriptional regulator [Bacteroidales bacterium]MBQ2599574.1 YebC/PmpR family DNA-binding transcriptional regulator [Bacteroidales bacterium]